MKRLVNFVFVLVMIFLMISIPFASAQNVAENSYIISLEGNRYILVELSADTNIARATTSKSKSYTCYQAGEMLWKITLSGSFTYDGREATCTSSNCTVTIYNSNWYTISKTAWADENIAKATVEMGEKALGVTIYRETYNLSLVCDRYGNVS